MVPNVPAAVVHARQLEESSEPEGAQILVVSGDRAGRACLSETAGPRT
jgi:hypothetical protein